MHILDVRVLQAIPAFLTHHEPSHNDYELPKGRRSEKQVDVASQCGCPQEARIKMKRLTCILPLISACTNPKTPEPNKSKNRIVHAKEAGFF